MSNIETVLDDTYNCARCGGSGREEWEEDGHAHGHTCYHCAGSGVVDEETNHHDLMGEVVHALACIKVNALRDACNNDPDGEGWDFRAAEHMMSPYDYFTCMVWEQEREISEELFKLSYPVRELLIQAMFPRNAQSGSLYALRSKQEREDTIPAPPPGFAYMEKVGEESDIPF